MFRWNPHRAARALTLASALLILAGCGKTEVIGLLDDLSFNPQAQFQSGGSYAVIEGTVAAYGSQSQALVSADGTMRQALEKGNLQTNLMEVTDTGLEPAADYVSRYLYRGPDWIVEGFDSVLAYPECQQNDEADTVVALENCLQGDELVQTPEFIPTVREHWLTFERVTDFSGNVVAENRWCSQNDPSCTVDFDLPALCLTTEIACPTGGIVMTDFVNPRVRWPVGELASGELVYDDGAVMETSTATVDQIDLETIVANGVVRQVSGNFIFVWPRDQVQAPAGSVLYHYPTGLKTTDWYFKSSVGPDKFLGYRQDGSIGFFLVEVDPSGATPAEQFVGTVLEREIVNVYPPDPPNPAVHTETIPIDAYGATGTDDGAILLGSWRHCGPTEVPNEHNAQELFVCKMDLTGTITPLAGPVNPGGTSIGQTFPKMDGTYVYVNLESTLVRIDVSGSGTLETLVDVSGETNRTLITEFAVASGKLLWAGYVPEDMAAGERWVEEVDLATGDKSRIDTGGKTLEQVLRL